MTLICWTQGIRAVRARQTSSTSLATILATYDWGQDKDHGPL